MPLTDRRPVLLATLITAGDGGEVGLILDRAGSAHQTLRLNKDQPLPAGATLAVTGSAWPN